MILIVKSAVESKPTHVHRLIRLNSSSILEEQEHPEYLPSIVQSQTHLGSMSPLGMGGEKRGFEFQTIFRDREEANRRSPSERCRHRAALSFAAASLGAQSNINERVSSRVCVFMCKWHANACAFEWDRELQRKGLHTSYGCDASAHMAGTSPARAFTSEPSD